LLFDTVNICIGDSVEIYGEWQSESGDYIETIDDGFCGSVETITLEVNQTIVKNETIILCPEDSVNIQGDWIYVSGIYDYTIAGMTGCDTSYTVMVELLVVPDEPIYELDCEELEIMTSIDVVGNWQISWSNGATIQQTTYNEGGWINVELYYEPDCYETYELELPELPMFSEIPTFADHMIGADSSISLSLGLSELEWKVNWSPEQIIDCTTCMDVVISPTQNTEVFITLTHDSGCEFIFSFWIILEEKEYVFDIPNVFSPNGDMDNDNWIVSLPNHIEEIQEGAIYDRWGNLIIRWENTNEIVWNGRFKGQLVNPGVFVYYLKYKEKGTNNNSTIIRKGDVTVVR